MAQAAGVKDLKTPTEQALDRIASALERLIELTEQDMAAADKADQQRVAYQADRVDPATCPHPREHRRYDEQGASVRVDCGLCGTVDIKGREVAR